MFFRDDTPESLLQEAAWAHWFDERESFRLLCRVAALVTIEHDERRKREQKKEQEVEHGDNTDNAKAICD